MGFNTPYKKTTLTNPHTVLNCPKFSAFFFLNCSSLRSRILAATHSLLFAFSGCIASVNIQPHLGIFYNVISGNNVLDIFS